MSSHAAESLRWIRRYFVLLAVALSSCEAAGDDGGPVLPRDGSWSGDGIEFAVSDEGGIITITYADYGGCAGGGCSSEAHATCGACSIDIDMGEGSTDFFEPVMGCEGAFVSPTRAEGRCSMASDCGCTMTHDWTAELE